VAQGRDDDNSGGGVMARVSVESEGEKQLRIWDTEKRENTDGRGATWAERFCTNPCGNCWTGKQWSSSRKL
jgi:hypothetical protein